METIRRKKEKNINFVVYIFILALFISHIYLFFLGYEFLNLSGRYPNFILSRIITKFQAYYLLHPKYCIWFCIFGEILFSGIIIWFSNLSYSWLSRDIDITFFSSVEQKLNALRANVYFCLFCTIFAISQRTELRSNLLLGILAIVHLIPLALCSYQALFRKTFREWPNFALSISVCLEYLSFLIYFYPNNAILGFIDGAKILEYAFRLTAFLAGGTLVAALATVLNDAIKEAFSQVKKSDTPNLSNFKNVRLRLLTHTPFYPRENFPQISSQIASTFLYLLICCTTIILPLASTNSDSPLPISFYLAILGMSAFILGVAAHFYASDESILKAEYSYVYYRVKYISAEDILHQTTVWKDYCQVVSNIYCSHSGLISEDEHLHRLWYPALEQMKMSNKACESQFISDIVYTHNSTYNKYYSNESDSYTVNNKKMAVDTIKYILDGTKAKPANGNGIIDVLFYATHCLFSNKASWERRFRAIQLTVEEAISVIFLDVCNTIVHEKSQIEQGCRVSSYCAKCSSNPKHICSDAFLNRAELLLSFPFIVQKCVEQRWGKNHIYIQKPDDLHLYYKNMLSSPYQTTDDVSLLDNVHRQWIAFSHSDLEDIGAFLKELCTEAHTESMAKNTADHIDRVSVAKGVVVDHKIPMNSHDYFSTPDLVREYSRQLVYFIFYQQS